MTNDEQVIVYTGQMEEVLFLFSLLNGSRIPAVITPDTWALGETMAPVLSVPRQYLDSALVLIEHFKEHGKKTQPS